VTSLASLTTCLLWIFVFTRCCTLTRVINILMQTLSNVHAGRIWPAGRRFPTPVLCSLQVGLKQLFQSNSECDLCCNNNDCYVIIADPRHNEPRRPQEVHCRRVSERLRQDQPGHDGAHPARLEGRVRRRRHCVDEV